MAEIFDIVRSEHVAAEGDPVAETSTYQMFDTLPVHVPPKKKVTRREECEMLVKTFTIQTSLAAGAAAADGDVWRSFRTFIAKKPRNYLPRTRNKVQHAVSNIIFSDDQGLLDVSYPVPNSSPAISGFLSHHSFLCCRFRRRKFV